MNKLSSFLIWLFFCSLSFSTHGQTSYLTLGSEEYRLLNRLETFSGHLTDFNSSFQPISRKDAIAYLLDHKKNAQLYPGQLRPIDLYNTERALSISGEWVENADGMDGSLFSRRPILKYFYQRQADLIHVNTDDFFLVVNPVLYIMGIKERNQSELEYINLRGAEIRGRISDRVGFYTFLADNQEKPVSYIRDLEVKNHAFPGVDYYRKTNKTNYDIFMARAYVDANFLRDHLNITFGYDKNFIGDGMRSLFLSDIGAPSTFLRLRSHYGKFSYQNLFMEAVPDYSKAGDNLLPKKYISIHKLDFKASPWLRIGLFESTTYSKQNEFSAVYLVPVILFNTVSQALGGEQKTSLGIDFKAITFRHLQFYGQAFFDQIKKPNFSKGYWTNQFGLQLGGAYYDALTISGLDLQAEVNLVRPFTYSSNDKTTNFTHYNQALAHPFGADFAEFIGKLYYQPLPKLFTSATGILSYRGTDTSASENFGNDIFKSNDSRSGDYGYELFSGQKVKGVFININIAYELRPRLFLEAGVSYLQRNFESGKKLPTSTSVYGGLRWNFSSKVYDFY